MAPLILLNIIWVSVWFWASYHLFRIYTIGLEPFHDDLYKPGIRIRTYELKMRFTHYLALLWVVEVITAFGIAVNLAIVLA